jgi:nucleoside-diphosphate-sugar epimerase
MVDYTGKRVLVTGATGFVGGRLAEHLAFSRQADLTLLVRDWRKAVWASRLPARLVDGDVTEPDSLAKAMADCQIVFHCVGVGGDLETCMRINREGTLNVLKAAAAAGVERVVYLSSIAVHGPNPPDNADERAPFVRTGSPYGDSKVAAEEALASFIAKTPLPVVTLRPTFVWGLGSPWFTLWPIRQMREGNWQLVDEGKGSCHAVHVDNLVHAMLLAGLAPRVAGEAFLVTDNQEGTWGEFFLSYARMLGGIHLSSVSSARKRGSFIRWIKRITKRIHDGLSNRMPSSRLVGLPFRATRLMTRQMLRWCGTVPVFDDWDLIKYGRRGALNTRKATERLGYIPQITREEGMRMTEAWLRDQRLLPSRAGSEW